MRLNESQNVRLVELYRDHPCLWDPGDPSYRSKPRRKAALQYILEELGIPEMDSMLLKTKIKGLRSCYHLEKNKIARSKLSGAAEDEVYTPAMKWFPIMDSFINNLMEKTTSLTNMEYPIDGEVTIINIPEDQYVNESTMYVNATSSLKSDNMFPLKRSIKKEPPSNRQSKMIKCLRKVVDKLEVKPQSSLSLPEKEDEITHLCKFIGASIRKMPSLMALQCTKEITGVVMNYLISAAEKRQEATPTSATEQEQRCPTSEEGPSST